MKISSLLVVLCLFGLPAFADDAQPVVAPVAAPVAVVAQPAPVVAAPVVAAPSKVEEKVKSAFDKIPDSIPAWLVAVLAFLCEIVMRFWPTVKPRSVFILVGNLFGLVGSGFIKISKLLDALVQNLKSDDPNPPSEQKVA